MDYSIIRFDSFAKAYREGLAKAFEKHPDEYLPGLTAKEIADKMLTKIGEHGIRSVNIAQSKGFLYACKELGLKQTYKEIEKYLKGA